MRWRELTVGIAGAAGMAEIGKIVEVAVGERAPHLHRRKDGAQSLAVAAGIADRHQAVGFLEGPSSVHSLLLPVLLPGRTRCRWSCRCRPRSPCRARCRP